MATFLVYEPRRAIREVIVQRLVGVAPPNPPRPRREASGHPARSAIEWVDAPEDLVTAYARHPAEVVLLGAAGSGSTGAQLTRQLLGIFPDAVIIVLGAAADHQAATAALEMGAHGFLRLEDLCAASPARPQALLKVATLAAHRTTSPDAAPRRPEAESSRVVTADHAVPVPPQMSAPPRSVDSDRSEREPSSNGSHRSRDEAGVSEREHQILVGISRGLSNAAIGAELYVAEDTVKTHARRLYRKLGVADRGSAVAAGFRLHLLQ